MFHQSEDDVFQFVQGPIAADLPPVRLDGHVSEIAVGIACFHQFGHQMVNPLGHLWIAGVGGKAAAGGDDLTHADIAPRLGCGKRRALAEGVEELLLQVDDHEILVDQVIDASSDLARQLALIECDRLQSITDFRRGAIRRISSVQRGQGSEE